MLRACLARRVPENLRGSLDTTGIAARQPKGIPPPTVQKILTRKHFPDTLYFLADTWCTDFLRKSNHISLQSWLNRSRERTMGASPLCGTSGVPRASLERSRLAGFLLRMKNSAHTSALTLPPENFTSLHARGTQENSRGEMQSNQAAESGGSTHKRGIVTLRTIILVGPTRDTWTQLGRVPPQIG